MSTNFQPGLVGARVPEYAILDDDKQRSCWLAIGVLLGLLTYAYWNTLARVAPNWSSPQYSHGWLIPLFAAGLLWMRREPFREVPMWHRWVGVGIVFVSVALRSVGAMNVIFSFDNFSFVPCIIGLFVIVGGLPTLRWAGPAIAFLVFMYPLPRFLEERVMYPLQSLATLFSVFLLRMSGVYAFREGNTIQLAERQMGVVEQCSGLRMLTIFAALSFALALIMRSRPWWERVIIVMSAFPIAIAVNVIRITVIALLYNLNVNSDMADVVFHDFGGWIMMPLALGLLLLETQILRHLVVEEEKDVGAWQLGGIKPAHGSLAESNK